MVVLVAVGFRNISVSVLVDFRIMSRSKKFICQLLPCFGMNFMFLCI